MLVIDDNAAIHEDFRKILIANQCPDTLRDAEAAFFGGLTEVDSRLDVSLDFADQGEAGLAKVAEAVQADRPYAVAFVDMRMPPGWDGLTTIERLWAVDADLQVVICTAYSDQSWSEICRRLGHTDRLLILKKPFDNSEVCQLVSALTEKWHLTRQARLKEADLERLLEERTEQLHQREAALRQQQKLESIGSLAGGIAHEFNNLLQAIQGYTQLAIEALPPEMPSLKDLQHVLSAAERAATLTRQLLTFSRRQRMLRDELDLNEVIGDVETMIRSTVGEHIQLTIELAPKQCRIVGDAGLVQQMLLHLCSNARDAMVSGGRLRISTELVELGKRYCESHATVSPGRYVRITVSDNGTGISKDMKHQVFDPFFTTKEVGQGSGLGLSMVYGTVQQHGGSIYVYSEPQQGTTFKIHLPLAAGQATEVTGTPTAVPAGGKETVLVAEDEPLVQELTVRVLEGAGYTVLAASDGQEAIELFDAHAATIDLAMLDMVMPKKSGKDVYEHIRSRSSDTKIVFATGYDPHMSQTEFAAHELVHLVQKPVDPDALLFTLSQALGKTSTDGAPERPDSDGEVAADVTVDAVG